MGRFSDRRGECFHPADELPDSFYEFDEISPTAAGATAIVDSTELPAREIVPPDNWGAETPGRAHRDKYADKAADAQTAALAAGLPQVVAETSDSVIIRRGPRDSIHPVVAGERVHDVVLGIPIEVFGPPTFLSAPEVVADATLEAPKEHPPICQ